MRKLALGIAVVLAGALLMLGAACGDDDGDGGDADGDSAAVEAAVRALADAWNGKDVEGLLALVTDNFLAEVLEGATREEARDQLPEFIGDPPEEIIEISGIEVTGDTATAIRDAKEGKLLTRSRGNFVREGDAWKLDSVEDLSAEIPDGVTAVDLSTLEYRFQFDETAITSGNIAFNISNIGGEQHVIDLAKIPEDLDIEAALQSDEEPPGIEGVGNIEPLDPGGGTTMVFTEPLAPGRYAMICWVETADGEPHYLKGMWAEFTIE
jgi:hypothetical protein